MAPLRPRMRRIYADAANLGAKLHRRPLTGWAVRPGLQVKPRGDGGAVVEITLVATGAEELTAALPAIMGYQAVDEPPAGANRRRTVDESPGGGGTRRVGDGRWASSSQGGPRVRSPRFMDLVRIGHDHPDAGPVTLVEGAAYTWGRVRPDCPAVRLRLTEAGWLIMAGPFGVTSSISFELSPECRRSPGMPTESPETVPAGRTSEGAI